MNTSNLGITEADFHEFISTGAGQLSLRTLHELASHLPTARLEFEKLAAGGFPRAARQLGLLADLLCAYVETGDGDCPAQTALEAAFAIRYLERKVDLIPDMLGPLGFTDDAAVVDTVVARNAAELERFAKARGMDWTGLAAHGV